MTESDVISIKTWAEALVKHERELRDQQIAQAAGALALQAREYERRLDTLDSAHRQMIEERGHYLPREVWDGWVERQDAWQQSVIERLAQEKAIHEEQLAARDRLMTLGFLLIALVTLALRFLPG